MNETSQSEILNNEYQSNGLDNVLFTKLYRYYRPRLKSFLYKKFLANNFQYFPNSLSHVQYITLEDISDIINESFLRLYNLFKNPEEGKKYKISTFLFTISKNLAYDHIRKQQIRCKNMQFIEFSFYGDLIYYDEKNSEKNYIDIEKIDEVFREDLLTECIIVLKKKYDFDMINMFYDKWYINMSYKEIYKKYSYLNIPNTTIVNKLFQMKQYLRLKIKQEDFLKNNNQ